MPERGVALLAKHWHPFRARVCQRTCRRLAGRSRGRSVRPVNSLARENLRGWMSPVRSRRFYILFSCCALALCFSTRAHAQEPEKVTLCQLESDPAAFNHHLVEITAFASRGFEDFTLFDPTCSSARAVWLEYGGTRDAGAMGSCGSHNDRKRPG